MAGAGIWADGQIAQQRGPARQAAAIAAHREAQRLASPPPTASFVAANGRAFTIEQRGAHEVVAAYDVTTGRERGK